jgi:hypothetical protein
MNGAIRAPKRCEIMGIRQIVILGIAATALAACEYRADRTVITDTGIDAGVVIDGLANIWIDPDGCQHWYIDDGLEGYMTPRLNRDGTPRCQDTRGEVMLKDGAMITTEAEPTPGA